MTKFCHSRLFSIYGLYRLNKESPRVPRSRSAKLLFNFFTDTPVDFQISSSLLTFFIAIYRDSFLLGRVVQCASSYSLLHPQIQFFASMDIFVQFSIFRPSSPRNELKKLVGNDKAVFQARYNRNETLSILISSRTSDKLESRFRTLLPGVKSQHAEIFAIQPAAEYIGVA